MNTAPIPENDPIPVTNTAARRSVPEPPAMPVSMPAPPEVAARDIKAIGVEGRPADAKSGPGMLLIEMGGIALGVLILAVIVGLAFGWGVGLAAGVIGVLAIAMNPVFGATVLRTRDRKIAADIEAGERAGTLVRNESQFTDRPQTFHTHGA